MKSELGDLLFSIVNFSRFIGVISLINPIFVSPSTFKDVVKTFSKKITFFGWAFKKNTNDTRESP